MIEAARNASERNIRFSVSTGLGNFYTSHEGPYVWCELRKESGELRNQELADIIRAKCKEAMRQSEARSGQVSI